MKRQNENEFLEKEEDEIEEVFNDCSEAERRQKIGEELNEKKVRKEETDILSDKGLQEESKEEEEEEEEEDDDDDDDDDDDSGDDDDDVTMTMTMTMMMMMMMMMMNNKKRRIRKNG